MGYININVCIEGYILVKNVKSPRSVTGEKPCPVFR